MMDMLLAGQVQVIFRKRENNLLRTLLCTLERKSIPPESYSTYSQIIGKKPDTLYVVWDIEKNDWRSFYMDSVLDFFPVKSG
jgi:hypothetical protein